MIICGNPTSQIPSISASADQSFFFSSLFYFLTVPVWLLTEGKEVIESSNVCMYKGAGRRFQKFTAKKTAGRKGMRPPVTGNMESQPMLDFDIRKRTPVRPPLKPTANVKKPSLWDNGGGGSATKS